MYRARSITLTALVVFLFAFTPAAFALDPSPLENAYWRFEEGPVGNPVNGSANNTVLDSKNANHMRTANSSTAPFYTDLLPAPVIPQTGAPNNLALSFAPTQDIYADGKNINHPITSAFTLEVSFNLNTIGGIYQALVSKDGKPTASPIAPLSFKARGDNSRLQIEILDGAGTARQVSSLNALSAFQWYHAAAINDGSNMSLYLDSNDGNGYVLQGSTAVSGALYQLNSSWVIGRGQYNGGNTDWTDGAIDEVRLSNVALHPTELLFHAPTGSWNVDADGNWSIAANWRSNLPSAAGHTARFGNAATAPRQVTLDSDRTVGHLLFEGPQSYTLAGPGILTFQSAGDTSPSITVTAGSHTISVPLAYAAPVTLAISPGAQLDITSSILHLATPAATIRQYLHDNLLTSSVADPNDTHSIGYLDTGSHLLVKLTLTGDANLDGLLNADDFSLTDTGYATAGSVWSQGDFNYDGQITPDDYLLIDSTYAKQQGGLSPDFLSTRQSQFGPDYVSTLLTSIPEPTSLLAACGLALFLPTRRHRPHS